MDDLISRKALLEFAHNHIGGTIDCNDIARFPASAAEPVMDDLISRKALLEELQKAYDNAHRIFQNQNSPESQECCKLQLRTLRSVIEDVKEAPTINAVEVVEPVKLGDGW